MAQVRAATGTRWNGTRPSRRGRSASTAPSGPQTTHVSLERTSSAGAESAHARCHAQLMKGDGASHAAGPSARASASDVRTTAPAASLVNGKASTSRTPPHRDDVPTDSQPSIRIRLQDTHHAAACCAEATPRTHEGRVKGGATLAPGMAGLETGEQRDMCGIAGVVYRERERPVPEALVRQMCSVLQHRGPDDAGVWVQGAAGLGMRRLSIIDLDGGRQPIFNEDGSKLIVFNGEIYNYQDLRHGLVARGHAVRSHSDTETVLHLYEELGADCVTPLRGMFAFAIWDASAETLLLARDRFGIKPLYVVSGPWGIAFASELKALHATALTSRELDWEALDSFFQLG